MEEGRVAELGGGGGINRRRLVAPEREPARDSPLPVAGNPRLQDPSPTSKQTQTIIIVRMYMELLTN